MTIWLLIPNDADPVAIDWPASLPVPMIGDLVDLDDGSIWLVLDRIIRLASEPPHVKLRVREAA